MSKPAIELDPATFDPWKISTVTHRLADHPLLQIDALVELGKRQEGRRLVRTHSDEAAPGSSFADAPNLHPNKKSAEDTLKKIAEARAWMSLLNIQADPVYRDLIDEVLDQVKPIVDSKDPGMCYRAGWIFVTSPNAVTPFHIDHEHNFILQIRGNKRLSVWNHLDREVVSEEGLELFHDQHSRDKVVWKDSMPARARVFELVPGMGGYMPSTSGHMVVNGNEPSVTISFTYYTDSTRRNELLYRTNAQLRRLGLHPHPVGDSYLRDTVKHTVVSTALGARNYLRKAQGKGIRENSVPYAPA